MQALRSRSILISVTASTRPVRLTADLPQADTSPALLNPAEVEVAPSTSKIPTTEDNKAETLDALITEAVSQLSLQHGATAPSLVAETGGEPRWASEPWDQRKATVCNLRLRLPPGKIRDIIYRCTSDSLKLVRLAISEASAYWYTIFKKSDVEMKICTRARRIFDAGTRLQEDVHGTFRANYLKLAVEEECQNKTLQVLAR
ncbi:hypothetical protein DL95DRAFT_416679 [Leptodontidium sp. 2 PMI_412]|nr:hypothetical protein DL95DRAFT_416679 [Leptodontidium sp. 2 PMI_412]